jgi:hypothetical protein
MERLFQGLEGQKYKESQIKKRILSFLMVSIMFGGIAGLSRADDDARIIGKLGQNSPKDHLRIASLYVVFKGNKDNSLPALPSGDKTRFYSKVWDDLYLQVTTEPEENGNAGYMFSFSTDEGNLNPVDTNESRDVPTLREVSAADFRSDDNFSIRPLKPGPGTPEDRGALRVIHYQGFDVEIRVLEFKIGDVELKEKPYFKSLSCLVTITETLPTESTK